jgi:hypothetical protein
MFEHDSQRQKCLSEQGKLPHHLAIAFLNTALFYLNMLQEFVFPSEYSFILLDLLFLWLLILDVVPL